MALAVWFCVAGMFLAYRFKLPRSRPELAYCSSLALLESQAMGQESTDVEPEDPQRGH
jgi:hypothetical protein